MDDGLSKLDTKNKTTTQKTAKIYAEIAEKRRQIQARLDAKLKLARGMDYELLILEFRRDLWLLAISFDHWAQNMDSAFNRQRKAPLRS